MNDVELRCTCSKRTLLGIARHDEKHGWHFHIKVYKQQKIYADIKVRGGSVEVACRECGRWQKVSITTERVISSLRKVRIEP